MFLLPGVTTANERRICCKLLILLVWCTGMLTGIYVSLHNFPNVSSWVHSYDGGVSIVSLLICSAFPFVIYAFLTSCGLRWLLLPLCFTKAFMYCFCACSVALVYGSGGWLARILLLFSNTVSTTVLLWYQFKSIDVGATNMRTITVACVLLVSLSSIFDHYIVTPIAVQILT